MEAARALEGHCGDENDHNVVGDNDDGDGETTRMITAAAAGGTKQQPTTRWQSATDKDAVGRWATMAAVAAAMDNDGDGG